jgi:Rrf2 family protein
VELSSKSEYALLALLELAANYQSGETLQIRQIAAPQNIPDRYLEQLLATLRRGVWLRANAEQRWLYPGKRTTKITLLEVWGCLEGLDAAPSEPGKTPKTLECAVVHEIWHEARQAANLVLQSIRSKICVTSEQPDGSWISCTTSRAENCC